MIESPENGRAIIKDGFDFLEIAIPAKKVWFILLFMIFWFGGWIMGETFAIKQIMSDDTPIFVNIFLFVWLLGWTAGGGFVLYIILWQLIGKELITLDRNFLTIQKNIYGFGRKKSYDVNSIKNLQLNSSPTQKVIGSNAKLNVMNFKGGSIQFDYGMKTIKFAKNIEDAEAKLILERIKKSAYLRKESFE